jgi:tetratricopeptide (TPR) repeat protein
MTRILSDRAVSAFRHKAIRPELLDFVAQGIVTKVNTVPARAYLFRAQGLRAAKGGELIQAAELLCNSAELFREIGWKLELARTYFQLSSIEERLGDSKLASTYLDQASELFENIGAKLELEIAISEKKIPERP